MIIRVELNCLGIFSSGLGSGTYNRVITAHGLGMIFLFIMPLLLSFAGNWLLPQSFGAMDFILPRVNLLSAYFLAFGALILVDAIAREEGAGTGWTVYAPLSGPVFHTSSAISIAILALHILGLSSEGGSITFFVHYFNFHWFFNCLFFNAY